jgi:Ca-activated chloride channel family protein
MTHSAVQFAPLDRETGQEVELAMQRLWLTGRLMPVGARLLVRHIFRSAEPEPLEVIYAFGLPRDAALRRFFISGEGFSVHSELRPVAEAVEAYERGVAGGSLSALAREYADGIVNLTVGNIRPGETVAVELEILAGVELHDGGLRFRFPFTLAPGYHRQARGVELSPGTGEMQLPESEFGDVILPQWKAGANGLHEIGFDLAVSMATSISEIGSPSHPVRVTSEEATQWRVRLATARDLPDRDLILDVKTSGSSAVLAETGESGRITFAAVVPSTQFGRSVDSPRRVVFVLDRSGSMQGAPIEQARRAVEACLGALSDQDRFGIVAFDNQIESLAPGLIPADHDGRERARRFLAGVEARGGTELAAGVATAAAMLAGGTGDLFVVTDGQVFGTEAILETARAAGARLHCLGIGSASQDRFLTLLARQTAGVSRFVTPGEAVDMAALDLFASAGRPVAAGVRCTVEGIVEPAPPKSVFAGTPLLVFGQVEKADGVALHIAWDGGQTTLGLPPCPPRGDFIYLLQGSRLVADLEARGQVQEECLEELSRTYGLASRRMALVAVVKREGDRPGETPATCVVPVGMPRDTAFHVYFSRARVTSRVARQVCLMAPVMEMEIDDRPLFRRAPRRRLPRTADPLIELAQRMEPDGGMPGAGNRDRAAATVLALLCFLAKGHSLSAGPFRLHMARLVAYLESVASALPKRERSLVKTVLLAARAGKPLPGDWLQLQPSEVWHAIELGAAQGNSISPT